MGKIGWSAGEIAYVKNAMGYLSPAEIAEALGRSERAVARLLAREGWGTAADATAEEDAPSLVWCDQCSTWRTSLESKTGWCRVCSLRERLARREAACAEALAALTPEERAVYRRNEARRKRRRALARPKMRAYDASDPADRRKAEREYAVALENWEYTVLKLRYDAVKTRLKRMRVKSGANPVKGSR